MKINNKKSITDNNRTGQTIFILLIYNEREQININEHTVSLSGKYSVGHGL